MAIERIKKIIKGLLSPKYFPSFFTFIVLLITVFSVRAMVAEDVIKIDRSEVVVRVEPSTKQKAISKIKKGEKVPVLSEESGWKKIRLQNGQTGWIPSWYLSSENLDSDQKLAGKTLKNTGIYLEPDSNSQHLLELEEGITVNINFESKGWSQIEHNQQLGYVKTSDLELLNQSDILQITDPHGQIAGEADLDETVIVRSDGQAFLSEPDYYSPPIYNPSAGDEFSYLETVYDDYGNEFYKVKDANGNEGYLETRIVSLLSDSKDHVHGPTTDSLIGATIVLDPGHGGEDAGAISVDGSLYEKNINFDTVMMIKEELESAGANVILTRDGDYMLQLSEISNISNTNEADAFISIHYDSIDDQDMSGVTTYYFHEADKNLADAISQELDGNGPGNNGINYGNFQVLRENNRPAILLELGYLSNHDDLKIIKSDKYYSKVAKSVMNGLVKYFSNDPSLTPSESEESDEYVPSLIP